MPRVLRRTLTALGVAGGVVAAVAQRWTADDAFISFRYARNLVDGLGLVYNAGERVEGYTNLLWTLLCALGLALGLSAEAFAQGLGVLCYAGLIWTLGKLADAQSTGEGSTAEDQSGAGLPLAALGAAAHADLWVFATSGLETSLFCLLSTAGLLAVLRANTRRARVVAGGLLGLTVLTRPDGSVFAVLGAATAAMKTGAATATGAATRMTTMAAGGRAWSLPRASLRAGLEVLLPVALLATGQLAFRLAYYGELLPNTFYAKSAATAWYAQGFVYLGFFLMRSWSLVVAALVAIVVLRSRPSAIRLASWPLLVAACAYALAIAHVGGDFMFARLLVPTIPLVLVAVERATRGLPKLQLGLTALVVLGCALTPLPDARAMWERGIVDERSFPDPQREQPGRAETLRRYFTGLPVRVAFTGGDARLMYRAAIPVAIESETGLTDHFIARRPLPIPRRRVGHEKAAPLAYLVRERKAHFVFRKRALELLEVRRHLPLVAVRFDDVLGYCLHWDAPLMRELSRRGARAPSFEAQLDQHIRRLPELTDLEVRRLYAKLELFYFAHNDDAARRAPFIERLAASPARPR